MKYASYLLLVFTLIMGPWGCGRAGTTDSAPATIEETVKDSSAVSTDSRKDAPVTEPPRRSSPAPRATRPAGTQSQPKPSQPAAASPIPTAADTSRGDIARIEPDVSAVTPLPVPRAPAISMATVPAGTPLTVVMSDLVSTATSEDGDTFAATLAESWAVDGKIVAERGDTVMGRVQDVIKPGNVKGRAQLKLVLTQISSGNRSHKISTEPFVAIAVANKERDAAIIAGGAGIGAAIGAITGGKKGAAIGAIIGGGSGTTAVLITPGQDMKIEPETKINFVLDDAVKMPIIRSSAS